MNTQKNFKANAQDNNDWQYEQEVRQARKASKQLRSIKRTRKVMWMQGE